MEKELTIQRVHYRELVQALQEAYPLEGCGLIAGEKGMSTHVYAVPNLLQSPVAFEMEPQQQLKAMIALEDAGWELLAIYHSHPQGPETPSETDVRRAYYPEALHLIVSLADPARPVARAFSIRERRVDEVLLKIL